MGTNREMIDQLQVELRNLWNEHINFTRESGREFQSHRDRLDAMESIHGKEYKGFDEPPHKGENMRTESEMAFGLLQEQVEELQGQVSVLESRMSVFETEPVQLKKVVKVNSFRSVADVEQIGTDMLFLGNQTYFKLVIEPDAQWYIELSYPAGESRFLSRSEDSLLDLLRYVREIVEIDQSRAKGK